MHPFVKLKHLLSDGRSLTGTVVAVANGTTVVRTRLGPMSLDIPVGLHLSANDRVRIESGVITGKLQAEAALPVFQT